MLVSGLVATKLSGVVREGAILPRSAESLPEWIALESVGLVTPRCFEAIPRVRFMGFQSQKSAVVNGFPKQWVIKAFALGKVVNSLRVRVIVHQSNIPRRVGVAFAAPDV